MLQAQVLQPSGGTVIQRTYTCSYLSTGKSLYADLTRTCQLSVTAVDNEVPLTSSTKADNLLRAPHAHASHMQTQHGATKIDVLPWQSDHTVQHWSHDQRQPLSYAQAASTVSLPLHPCSRKHQILKLNAVQGLNHRLRLFVAT